MVAEVGAGGPGASSRGGIEAHGTEAVASEVGAGVASEWDTGIFSRIWQEWGIGGSAKAAGHSVGTCFAINPSAALASRQGQLMYGVARPGQFQYNMHHVVVRYQMTPKIKLCHQSTADY